MFEFDTNIFYFINNTLKNGFFDIIMPIITNIKYWRIPLILGWIILMVFGGSKGREVGILVVLAIALTDAFVAEVVEKIDDIVIRSYIQQRVAQHEAF